MGIIVSTFIIIGCFMCLLFLLINLYLLRKRNFWKNKGIPYEKAPNLFELLWKIFKENKQFSQILFHAYNKHESPHVGIFILGKPFLLVRNPQIMKNVTIRDFSHFEDRFFTCDKKADILFSNALFSLKGVEWKSMRTKLTPIFSSGKIKMMFDFIKNTGMEMDKYLTEYNQNIVDAKKVSRLFTVDSAGSTLFGMEINAFKPGPNEFVENVDKLFNLSLTASFRLFAYFFASQLVSLFKFPLIDATYFEKVFLANLEERKKTLRRRNDFVDLLLDLQESELDSDVKIDSMVLASQAITFYFATTETNSSWLAFALYELCIHQDIQTKLREEINKYVRNDDDITYENVAQIKYLDWVLFETLRKYPFGQAISRECSRDYFIKETNFLVEKDLSIIYPQLGLHYDPEYFPNPDKFIPERFNNLTDTQALAYIPFGDGPRNCIGKRFSMILGKVGLLHFVRYNKFESCEGTPIPLKLDPRSFLIKPIGGFPMRIQRLEKSN